MSITGGILKSLPPSRLGEVVEGLSNEWSVPADHLPNYLKRKGVKDEEIAFSEFNPGVGPDGRVTADMMREAWNKRTPLFGQAAPHGGGDWAILHSSGVRMQSSFKHNYRLGDGDPYQGEHDGGTGHIFHTRGYHAEDLGGSPARVVAEIQSDTHTDLRDSRLRYDGMMERSDRARRGEYTSAPGLPPPAPFVGDTTRFYTKGLEYELHNALANGDTAIAVPISGGMAINLRRGAHQKMYETRVQPAMQKLAKKYGLKYDEIYEDTAIDPVALIANLLENQTHQRRSEGFVPSADVRRLEDAEQRFQVYDLDALLAESPEAARLRSEQWIQALTGFLRSRGYDVTPETIRYLPNLDSAEAALDSYFQLYPPRQETKFARLSVTKDSKFNPKLYSSLVGLTTMGALASLAPEKAMAQEGEVGYVDPEVAKEGSDEHLMGALGVPKEEQEAFLAEVNASRERQAKFEEHKARYEQAQAEMAEADNEEPVPIVRAVEEGLAKKASSRDKLYAELQKQMTPAQKQVVQVAAALRQKANEQAQKPPAIRRIQHGFETTPADYQNLEMWLGSRFPAMAGKFYFDNGIPTWKSADEIYGEGFTDLPIRERLEVIREAWYEEQREGFEDVEAYYRNNPEADLFNIIGVMGGAMASPSMALPMGKGYAAAAGIGAGIGAADAALWQLAHEDRVTADTVGLGAGVGLVAAPALMALGRGVKKVFSPRTQASLEAQNAAKLRISRLEEEYNILNSGGELSPDELWTQALARADMTEETLTTDIILAGRKPSFPVSARISQQLLEADNNSGIPFGGPPGLVGRMVYTLYGRLAAVDQNLADKMNNFEFRVAQRVKVANDEADAFFRYYRKLPKDQKRALDKALFNSDKATAVQIMARYFGDDGAQAYNKIRASLNKFSAEMDELGYGIPKIENYFPRVITDFKGLMKAMDKEDASKLDEIIQEAQKRANKEGRDLSELEKSNLANRFFMGWRPLRGKPGYTKVRKSVKIPEKLLDFYAPADNSLSRYIRQMSSDIETRRFFGDLGVDFRNGLKQLAKDQGVSIKALQTGKVDVVNASIGAITSRMKLTPGELDEVRNVLRIRFNMGDLPTSALVQDTKNLLYASTLANPFSALTQLGDIGIPTYMNGFRNTFAAMFKAKEVDLKDFGLDELAIDMVSDIRATSKMLDKLMSVSQFRRLDHFGKNTVLNGSLRKLRNHAKTEEGAAKIRQRWGKYFDGNMGKVLSDLAEGRMSDDIKFLLWSDLTRMQPLSLSQMPEKYITGDGVKLMYMLKSFTIKQIDLVRQDIVRHWKKGHRKEAVTRAAVLTAALGGAGWGTHEIKSVLLGREPDVADAVLFNTVGVLGASPIILRALAEGKVGEAGIALFAPPVRVLDDIGTSVANMTYNAVGKESVFDESRPVGAGLRQVPVVGRFLHNYWGGGLEAYEKQQQLEKDARW